MKCPKCGGELYPDSDKAWYRCLSCYRTFSKKEIVEYDEFLKTTNPILRMGIGANDG